MSDRRITATIVGAIVIAAAILYTAQLDRVPPFLSYDETAFALQAHAIATTAHDQNGRLLPLYFQVFGNVWFHPALVYAMAPVLTVAPPVAWAVRLPTVIVALISIALACVVACRLGASRAAAIGGAVLLMLTPAHFMHGRLACDYLFPVPFVLAWLILLVDAHRTHSSWRYFATGCVLGAGLYTYIPSVMMMPLYLGLTHVVLFASGVRQRRPYVMVTTGFVLLVTPLAIYLLATPEVYAGFVGRYGGSSVDLDVVNNPRGLFNTRFIAERWPIYRSFFEWRFLFDRAETNVLSSTYVTGVFLKAMQVLLPLGMYHIVRNRRTPFTLLLLVVFFTAPLAASLIPEKYAIDRALVLITSGAIIGAFGIDWLLLPRAPFLMWPARAVGAGLLVWMVVQFNGFHHDYRTDYRNRAAVWFGGNHPGAFAPLVDQHPPDDRRFIYLSSNLSHVEDHWKLYLLSRRRIDLLKRTVYFSPQELQLAYVQPGSLLLTGADDPVERSLLKLQAVRRVSQVTDPDGSPSFNIFERTPWVGVYPFDGSYATRVMLTCPSAAADIPCTAPAPSESCKSSDTIRVTNGLLTDTCGYFTETAIADDGSFAGVDAIYGLPIRGSFNTNGTARLSGSGLFNGSRYEFVLQLAKQE